METTMPIGNTPELKEKSLNQTFRFLLSRKQCIILANTLRPISFPVSDLRGEVLREIVKEIEKTAFDSIKPDDYESTPLSEVKTV